MRPRIRSIKPEAFLDEDLWDAELQSGLPLFRAFAGLWCHADREGRFQWRPRALKAGILPYWDGDFSRVLDVLVTCGFLVKYTLQGRHYGFIPTFEKHQHINGKEPASELPAPPKTIINSGGSRVAHVSTTCESHVPDVSIPSLPFLSVPDPAPDQEGGAGGNQPEAESGTVRKALPGTLEQALKLPLTERAAIIERDPSMAQWLKPHQWPEVLAVAREVDPGRKVGAYHRDSGVKALVGLFADGWEPDAIVALAPDVLQQLAAKGGNPGLSSLTPETLNRARPRKDSPGYARVRQSLERAKREQEELERKRKEQGRKDAEELKKRGVPLAGGRRASESKEGVG